VQFNTDRILVQILMMIFQFWRHVIHTTTKKQCDMKNGVYDVPPGS